MPPIHVLIKPVSSNCNMRCQYCFYLDTANNRTTASYGIMTSDLLKTIIQKALDYSTTECTFAFQGGEPTLAGLDFFKQAIKLQQTYNHKNIRINNTIQTNGLAVSTQWAEFFKKHNFLVGLSLDGTKDTHNTLRCDTSGNDTFNRVIATTKLFDEYNVEYNILTVVNSQTAKRAESIYNFYRKNGFDFLQFIPCLEPFNQPQQQYSLTPKAYTQFLKTLFDLWYRDIIAGKQVHIRQFENYVEMLLGYPPESCGMSGNCSMQNVIEADGSVFPCDFYVLDQYYLGNISNTSFIDLRQKAQSFIADGENTADTCTGCKYLRLCNGGCRRYRVDDKNRLCQAYYAFFEYALPRLTALAQQASHR